jgi:hypothetical protein
MVKNKLVLEIKINDKFYQLLCDPDSQLGQLHDALSQMRQYVVQQIVDADKKTQVKEQDAVVEEAKIPEKEGS